MRMFLPFILSWVTIPLVASFSWESCDRNALLKIDNLSLGQNQTMVIQVKGQCNLTGDILSPLRGELIVSKKMFWGWTRVPCIKGMGSCSYDDLCQLSPYGSVCPNDLKRQGLPCSCPIKKGPYAGSLSMNLKAANLPKWLETGNYRIRAKLTTDSKSVLCLKLEMALK